MSLPSGLDFHDESLKMGDRAGGWPPPVDDFTATLVETIRVLEAQRAVADDKAMRLLDSNKAYQKRCHHYEKQILVYEKQILVYEKAIDRLVDSSGRRY